MRWLLLLPLLLTACVPVNELEYRGQMRDCSVGSHLDPVVYSVLLVPTAESALFGIGSFRGRDTWVVTKADVERITGGFRVSGEFALAEPTGQIFSVDLHEAKIVDEQVAKYGFTGWGTFVLGDQVEDCDSIILVAVEE